MGNHKKAASCTAIPSFTSFTSLTDKNTVPNDLPTLILNDKLAQASLHKERPHRSQSFYISNTQFPLPSFCLYSRAALSDEYATESDIIQFISPQSKIMEERLPMFVGVLHSLFVAVNDLQFDSNSDTEDDDEDGEEGEGEREEEDDIDGEEVEERTRSTIINKEEEEGEEEEEEEEKDDNTTIHEEKLWLKKDKKNTSPFSIIGLNTMKIISCDLIEEGEQQQDISKELGLAIMVPAHFSDRTITYYTSMLYNSITKSNLTSNTCAKDIGEQIAPMIHYWFSAFHGDKIIAKET